MNSVLDYWFSFDFLESFFFDDLFDSQLHYISFKLCDTTFNITFPTVPQFCLFLIVCYILYRVYRLVFHLLRG